MKYLAVFKGRSGCLKCFRRMSDHGISARVVNTPRETGYGCGISIEIDPSVYGQAATITVAADGFRGWWAITEISGGRSCTRL